MINLLSLFAEIIGTWTTAFAIFFFDKQAKKKGTNGPISPVWKKILEISRESNFFFNQNYKKRLIVTKAWKEPLESRKPPTECLDRVLFEENLPDFFFQCPSRTYIL